jgi:hypothetical protein
MGILKKRKPTFFSFLKHYCVIPGRYQLGTHYISQIKNKNTKMIVKLYTMQHPQAGALPFTKNHLISPLSRCKNLQESLSLLFDGVL